MHMKRSKSIAFPSLLVAGLALSVTATAQNRQLPNYSKIATITVPGNLSGGFDISWVDSANQKYYLANRVGKGGGRIDVIDTRTNTYLYSIPGTKGEVGFVGVVGPGKSGPNGVVAIPSINELYVGDGDSTVKVVDLTAKAVIAVIPTGGKFRADELAYDSQDHIVMITNPNDSPPFLTFISTDTLAVLGTLQYPADQVGLEQPVWNGQLKKFMISVPAVPNVSTGEVDVIDPIAMQVTSRLFLNCSPAGLALGPFQRVMTSCAQVFDARTGATLAYSQGNADNPIGGDEIWFNPGDNRYYFGSGNVGVVDAETNQPLGFLDTNVPTHSIAVDSSTNHIFVPATRRGVFVYAQTGP
jgi:DNA-binding beta-propeller fold protein YncE